MFRAQVQLIITQNRSRHEQLLASLCPSLRDLTESVLRSMECLVVMFVVSGREVLWIDFSSLWG
jgi:hypothetical protein